MARAVPFVIKKDKAEVGNYRPVSILVLFQILFKELFMNRLNVIFLRTIYCLLYSSYIVRIVLLVLQKAFDTVDQSILLMKQEVLSLLFVSKQLVFIPIGHN